MFKFNTAAVMLFSMIAFASPVLAEQAGVNKDYIEAQNAKEWLASHLIGEDVMNLKGEAIGDINDLVLSEEQKLHAVVIGIGGFLGIAEKDVAVPVSALTIVRSKDGIKITLNATKESLEAAPTYKTIDDQKGGVTTKIKNKMSKWGDKVKDAADKTKEKAKETYEDVKESVTDKK